MRINGQLSAAHLGEHHLWVFSDSLGKVMAPLLSISTIEAMDHGLPPQESRAVLSVRIDGQFAWNVRETPLGPLNPGGGMATSSAAGKHPSPAGSQSASPNWTPAASSLSSADYESVDKDVDIWRGTDSSSSSRQSGQEPPVNSNAGAAAASFSSERSESTTVINQ